jgi:hypothetical protein
MALSARGRVLWLAVLLPLVLHSVQLDQPELIRAQAGTGSISGQLTEDGTGLPVEWKGSVCAAPNDPGIPTDCGIPGTDGHYLIDAVPAGDYFVWWEGDPAYARMAYPHSVSFWSGYTLVHVDEGGENQNINMALEPGGRISGFVKDEDTQAPIAAGVVIAFLDAGSPPYYEGCADDSGYYELVSVPLGLDYSVFAFSPNDICSDPGLHYLGEWWSGFGNPGAETPGDQVYLRPTLAVSLADNVNFELDSNANYGSISGRVTDQTTGAAVSLGGVCAAQSDVGASSWCDTPDSLGYYLIKDLPAESWAVWWDGDPTYARMAYQDHLAYWGTNDLVDTVLGEVTQAVDFALRPGGRFSGQIVNAETGAPIPDSTIYIDVPDDGIWGYYESCTDGEGSFRLESVALDLGFLLAGSGGGDTCPAAPFFPGEIWRESDDAAHARIEVLTLSNRYKDNILFTLAPPYDTPAGGGIVVEPLPDLTLTFDNVDEAGTTWADEVPPDSFPPPAEFMVVDNYFSVGTTAVFSGSIHLCFHYDDTGVTPEQEAQIRLLHSAGGSWVDVTDVGYPNLGDNVVCGTVSTLSTFAIVIPGFSLYLPAFAR